LIVSEKQISQNGTALSEIPAFPVLRPVGDKKVVIKSAAISEAFSMVTASREFCSPASKTYSRLFSGHSLDKRQQSAPSVTYGASASRLPSRHGGREPISTPRRRRSGVRTLTKRGPAAFPEPSLHIPLASTCLAPASSFCGRSFQTRKTSIRSSSRAAETPFGVLFFS